MDPQKKHELEVFAAEIRLETARSVTTRGFGHLPGSLSVVDALAYLYGGEMKYDPENPKWDGRDYLVMSKGHAGPAVYAALALKGFFPVDELLTLNQPGTRLPSHCDRQLTPGIDMTTGSLGQGVSTAIGLQLANQLAGNDRRTFLFVGDGESNEGQVWEGAMFAAHHKMHNLCWFYDYNRKQLDGPIEDVMEMGDVAAKFRAFDFNVVEIDGHDMDQIDEAIRSFNEEQERPTCIVMHTHKGQGVQELIEMKLNHHIRLAEDQSADILSSLEQQLNEVKEAVSV